MPSAFLWLTLGAIGILSYFPAMWAMPTSLLSARTAAASFGFMNLIANLGGFAGPYAVGFLTDRTGTYSARMYLLVSTALLDGIIIATIRHRRTQAPRARSSFASP